MRVRQQYIDPADGTVVPRSEIVKGYEFSKDRYVTFTKEELEVVETPKAKEIEIVSFVPKGSVDRMFSNRVYYLAPGEGGGRPYRLLARALRKTGRVAIAKQAARGRQYVVMIRPHPEKDGLVMEQLHYADELRSIDVLDLEEGEVSEGELGLAVQLIEQGAAEEFDAAAFRDEVRERTLELIQAKVDGEDITKAGPPEEQGAQVVDIMAALKASLAGNAAAESSRGPGDAEGSLPREERLAG